MSNFAFLQGEWPAVSDAALRAKIAVHGDTRTACLYARRTPEMAVAGDHKYDSSLKLHYQGNLSRKPSCVWRAGRN